MMKLGNTALRGSDLVSHCPLLSVVLFRVGYHTSDLVPVWAGDFLSNRRTLLTGGVDRTIRRWDAENRSAANPPEAEVEGPPVFGSE